MTPEQRAAAKLVADEIRAEQAARPAPPPAPIQYAPAKGKSVSEDAAAAQDNAASVGAQIDEIYGRSGGYLRRNQSTDHMN